MRAYCDCQTHIENEYYGILYAVWSMMLNNYFPGKEKFSQFRPWVIADNCQWFRGKDGKCILRIFIDNPNLIRDININKNRWLGSFHKYVNKFLNKFAKDNDYSLKGCIGGDLYVPVECKTYPVGFRKNSEGKEFTIEDWRYVRDCLIFYTTCVGADSVSPLEENLKLETL